MFLMNVVASIIFKGIKTKNRKAENRVICFGRSKIVKTHYLRSRVKYNKFSSMWFELIALN